ncbi:MAG TPA: SDR family oxidoreductase [Ktedonobacterales bacterium]|jgi:putative NADH-flavin reductase|nr:SDR family oxidoreductase [Ktedonobacterales bacterium]
MKIVVFGANGATGQHLTKQALAAGHTVTAVTRHPEAFPLEGPRLQVVWGDVYDLASVERAVAGQDTVLSTLGVPFTRKPITVYSQGIAHIIAAMNRYGVRRLACISSSATGGEHDTGGGFLFDKVLQPIVMSTIGRTTYADMARMEALVMNSDLDWVIVRPSGLFETPVVTDYQVAETQIRGQFTSRIDLADFMLKQATSDLYLRKVMAIATYSMTPSVFVFMTQEAFKKPEHDLKADLKTRA